jgi:two-component system chemotaxis response regulator CheB
MRTVLANATDAPLTRNAVRVMVVDDAVVARSLVMRWVDAEPDMEVTAVFRTGREAVDQIEAIDPDVVLLDVDMPELDGIAALPLLLKKKRDLVVIMVSALTRRSAELSLRALSLGAMDYIPKPQTSYETMTSSMFRRELIERIRSLGHRKHLLHRPTTIPAAAPAISTTRSEPSPFGAPTASCLRPFSVALPRVLLIGSSTGGPQALTALLGGLRLALDTVPMLITQHMPPTFTTVLAEHLTRASGRRAHEAEHGEEVLPGGIYVAPGGRHMRVVRGRGGPIIVLGDDPAINFCKPAVDPLFASAAQCWGAGCLAVVLTGMGNDGTGGAAAIVAAGGNVIAQDEATSVVWGMPRSVAQAGLCAAVLPLGEIAARIDRLFSGDRS